MAALSNNYENKTARV